MSDEEIQRTLVAEFPPIYFATDRDGNVTSTNQGGYSNNSLVNTAVFYMQVNLDLSGYALQKKTFYPYSSFEQRSGPVVCTFLAGSNQRVYDTIICSSVPLDDAFMISYAQNLPGFTPFNLAAVPGGPEAYRHSRDTLLHQHQLIYNFDDTTAGTGPDSIYRIISDTHASSLEPTAADELYCYRIILSGGTEGNASIPAARLMLPGTIASEPKLEYMMRLKRSYELANQV